MKIGVDLDGVIFDTEKLYRVYAELYDVKQLEKNSIIDNRNDRFQMRYNWTDEENKQFVNKYHEDTIKNANFMTGAKTVLKMLKEEGHELVIITQRGYDEKKYIQITKEIFKENDFEIFDKYYWGIVDKQKVCAEEKIDLMIDDYIENCKKISNAGIKTIYLKDAPSYKVEDTEYLKTLYNWGEIYRYINQELIK